MMDVVDRYFAAWNAHDPAAVLACYAVGGTYVDPTTPGPLAGEAIARNVADLCVAYPDLSFEMASRVSSGGTTAAMEWVMRGANTGALGPNPPTGRTIAVPGVDLFTLDGDAIRSVHGYFDRQTFYEQLGLQVQLMPPAQPPLSVGGAMYLDIGNRAQPGAMSITALQLNSAAEMAEIGAYVQRITAEMTAMPGFISALNVNVGTRAYTITAWDDVESSLQLKRAGTHPEAMRRFYGPDFTAGGVTSVWAPARMNAMWVRCTTCGRMADSGHRADSACPHCGAALPAHPAYF